MFCRMDLISALPVDVKLEILQRGPFEEAARADILSSTSIWSDRPQLVFNKFFFEERGRWIALDLTAWVDRVNETIRRHNGPIGNVILHVPDKQFKWAPHINIWVFSLSRKSIEGLTVDNCQNDTYKIGFLSSCLNLTRLELRNCIFNQSSGVFRNLLRIYLEKIAFGSNQVGTVNLDAPSLVFLKLSYCVGFKYLNVHAPNLKTVSAVNEYDAILDDEDEFSLRVRSSGCRSVSWLFCG